jgi:hypothetical protein
MAELFASGMQIQRAQNRVAFFGHGFEAGYPLIKFHNLCLRGGNELGNTTRKRNRIEPRRFKQGF